MVGASKILTVSYGTFSCTLEGFDEPFSTMKAIAEYFRDLAADDRYFGAEPPTPDAEMLHRIAEREIHRRVEAKIGAHGITLRPQEPPAPVAPESAAATYAEFPLAAAPAADFVPPPAAVPQPGYAPIAAAPTQPAPNFSAAPSIEDTVAAKLARIRAAVAGARMAAAQPIYEDEAPAADFSAPDSDFGFEIDLGGPLQSGPEEAAEQSHDATPVPPEAVTAPPPESTPEPGTVPIQRRAARRAARTAATLAALTSAAAPLIAASAEAETSAAAPAPGPVAAEPVPTTEAAPMLEARADEQPPAAPRDETDHAVDWVDADADDEFAPLPAAMAEATDLPEVESPAEHVSTLSTEPTPEQVAATSADQGDETGIAGAFPVLSADAWAETAPEAEPESPAPIAAAPETMAPADVPDAADIWLGTEPDEAYLAPEPVPVAVTPPPRARVIKVRRADARAAADTSDSPAAPEPAVPSDEDTLSAVTAALAEPAAPPAEPALLSPEAEAELARELAELEAEIAPEADFTDDEDLIAALAPEPVEVAAPVAEPAPAPAPSPRAAREATTEPAEANLSRLLNETNSKLEGPENRRRFSAIAHLKAAVAATVADRKLRSADEAAAADADEARDLERYREDLTKAVRPRRPAQQPETATHRPAPPEHRPAPLVLVSEQRIDRPRNAATQPNVIRPRRISMAQAAAALPMDDDDEAFDVPLSATEARGFAEFAAKLGARELPELLEAAAAYTARVEGLPHFSRPDIIRKVAALSEDAGYDREAGLRSFGTLLRQGKIAKVKRGQFAITEASRFYSRAAGSR